MPPYAFFQIDKGRCRHRRDDGFISLVIRKIVARQDGKLRARPTTRQARDVRSRIARKVLRFAQDFGRRLPASLTPLTPQVWIAATGIIEGTTNKEMTHRFPCQDAFASNRWISFLYVSCQVLQLLTLEAASRKRLPEAEKLLALDVALSASRPVTDRASISLSAAEPVAHVLRPTRGPSKFGMGRSWGMESSDTKRHRTGMLPSSFAHAAWAVRSLVKH